MTPHIHATAHHVLFILAVVWGTNFLVRTAAAHHANGRGGAFFRALAYVT